MNMKRTLATAALALILASPAYGQDGFAASEGLTEFEIREGGTMRDPPRSRFGERWPSLPLPDPESEAIREVKLVFDSGEIKFIVNQQVSRRRKSLSLHTGA